MHKVIIITILCSIIFSIDLSAQYYNRQQVFEYEVINKGRGDTSLTEYRSEYHNAEMMTSGGQVIMGIGIVMIPIGGLTELSNIASGIQGKGDNGSSASVLMGLGVVVAGLGIVSWTIGNINRKRVVNKYFRNRDDLGSKQENPTGHLSTTASGLHFLCTF